MARLALTVCTAACLAVAALASASAAGGPMRIVFFSFRDEPYQRVANIECVVGFRSSGFYGFGFAAELSDAQAARVRLAGVAAIQDDPAGFIVQFPTSDRAAVERRTRELEERFGFRREYLYSGPIGGFAAHIGWRSLALLSEEADLRFAPDPYRYLVIFDEGVDVNSRVDELEQRYGFRARHRFHGTPKGFSGELRKDQVAGLASEPGIRGIHLDTLGRQFERSNPADCVRPDAATKRALQAAFLRRNPGVRYVRLVSARVATWKGNAYALATFRGRGVTATTQPERFARGRRWSSLGPTNGRVCVNDFPLEVLRLWLLPWAGPCARVR